MIKTGLFDRNYLSTLKKAVDVYARRHAVTARNVANVETPGYQTEKVKFEEMLDRSRMSMAGTTTDPRHIPINPRNPMDLEEQVVAAETGFDNGVNDVDIDTEMTDLATTDLSYRMATRLLSMRYNMLSSAIKGRVV
ncbi:flagellar basal body rod protein FlgB [bacterium]|nr:flagellar basal body rod protein FlgB [bacterium]PIV76103.1 MAG: flagellar basal body rod protein FlgB [Rhodocyclales bacterium CG17_big_fil_post_rev_8_21_14_2_50_68_7]PJA75323.1 MAG: flagellar basal body rod protein FlgB [bacterium CG_4_9_14_3_um_filter_65_15]